MLKIFGCLSLFFSVVCFADCNDDPNNLISSFNCAFDESIDGWDELVFPIDSIVHDSTQDFLSQGMASGSALVDAQDNGEFSVRVMHTCLILDSTDAADKTAGVWLRVNSGSGVTCNIELSLYSGMICDAINQVGECTTGPVPDIAIDGNWSQLSCNSADTGPLTATPMALFSSIFCRSDNDFTINVDNMYIGQEGLLPVELLNFSVD